METERICETCRWFDPSPPSAGKEAEGECHRFPPQHTPIYESPETDDPGRRWFWYFPQVGRLDWCGEWTYAGKTFEGPAQ